MKPKGCSISTFAHRVGQKKANPTQTSISYKKRVALGMTTLPSHAHKGRCIYNSSVQSDQILQLMYLPKTQAKSIMTKALGGTNHFGKKYYAQLVSTGENIISQSQTFNTLLASGHTGSNHSTATAWDRGNRSFHRDVSNKASAKS